MKTSRNNNKSKNLFKSFIKNGISRCGVKMSIIFDIDPIAVYYMYADKYGSSRFNLEKPVKRHFDLRKAA